MKQEAIVSFREIHSGSSVLKIRRKLHVQTVEQDGEIITKLPGSFFYKNYFD